MYVKIVFVCLALLFVHSCELKKLEKVYFNQYLPNSITDDASYYTFNTLIKINVKQCIEACQKTKDCEYINYERRYSICGLLRRNENIYNVEASNSIIKIEPVMKPGHIFGKKSEWTKVDLLECDHCEQNEDCEKEVETETSLCRRQVCARIKNSEFMGNMFSPGSKIVVTCLHGYTKIPDKDNHGKATCLSNGTWNNQFVCLNGYSFNRSFYHISPFRSNWFYAKIYCQSMFGHLVDIETEDEQQFIATLLKGNYKLDTWTGGNSLENNEVYVWSDGTSMTFTYWFYNQPDTLEEQCVEILVVRYDSFPYRWNDEYCGKKLQIICEIPVY